MENQKVVTELAEVVVRNIRESVEDEFKASLNDVRSKISVKKEPFLRQIISQQYFGEQNEIEKTYTAHDVLTILESIDEEIAKITEGYARDEE